MRGVGLELLPHGVQQSAHVLHQCLVDSRQRQAGFQRGHAVGRPVFGQRDQRAGEVVAAVVLVARRERPQLADAALGHAAGQAQHSQLQPGGVERGGELDRMREFVDGALVHADLCMLRPEAQG